MSQHLNTLYQAGILGRRREGVSNCLESQASQARRLHSIEAFCQ
jgi:hypothetical protein